MQCIQEYISRYKIVDNQVITFANNSLINTQVTITLNEYSSIYDEHEIVVYNPSTVSALSIKIFTEETSLGGGTRNALLYNHTVPAATTTTGTTINTHAFRQSNMWCSGKKCIIVFSNNSALGAAEGFTAYLRVTAIK